MIIFDEHTISFEEANKFRELVLNNKDVGWKFFSSTNGKISSNGKNFSSNFQLVLPIYPVLSHGLDENSEIVKLSKSIFEKVCLKNNVKIEKILKIKFNLLPKENYSSNLTTNVPHVDLKEGHMVFLYYINDSDGDTVFFEEKYEGTDRDPNLLKEYSKSTPKMGKSVIFDGTIYHASTPPTGSNYRCILNIDFNGELLDKL